MEVSQPYPSGVDLYEVAETSGVDVNIEVLYGTKSDVVLSSRYLAGIF